MNILVCRFYLFEVYYLHSVRMKYIRVFFLINLLEFLLLFRFWTVLVTEAFLINCVGQCFILVISYAHIILSVTCMVLFIYCFISPLYSVYCVIIILCMNSYPLITLSKHYSSCKKCWRCSLHVFVS